jgi:hypothetical protein
MNFHCNPVDIPYKFQKKKDIDYLYREGADPTLILYKDMYLLFLSKTGGFYYSKDLYNWEFKKTEELPIDDYAPDVRIVNDVVTFTASKSKEPCCIYTSHDPLNEPFKKIQVLFPYTDPCLFYDEDTEQVFLYWGCSTTEPLYGIELDNKTFAPIGDRFEVVNSHQEDFGWERRAENNIYSDTEIDNKNIKKELQFSGDPHRPYIEGGYMSKHNGLYYYQYAVPGTQLNVYSDAAYISKSPKGPFEIQCHNAFSMKSGGFITGAGQSNTFEDKYGNFFHISTMRLSNIHKFERRIGLFPAGYDEDGIIYCNTNYGDYPRELPTKKINVWDNVHPNVMLLSYNKDVTVSSTKDGHDEYYVTDEDIRTSWCARRDDKNPELILDLKDIFEVSFIQINFGEVDCKQNVDYECVKKIESGIIVEDDPLKYIVQASVTGQDWTVIEDNSVLGDSRNHHLVKLNKPEFYRYFKVKIIHMSYDGLPSISGLRVFGKGKGKLPKQVAEISNLSWDDNCTLKCEWIKSEGAIGYNFRWGISPSKIYSSHLIYGDNKFHMGCFKSNTSYYAIIEAFNENGITESNIFKLR